LPPPPITTAIPEVSFDIDSPSDSASLLFLTNPDLLPDVDLDQDLDEETPIIKDEEALEDDKFIVQNRNRVLQNLAGRSRRPFLQRRPSKARKPVPVLPTIAAQEEDEVIDVEEDNTFPLDFEIPLDSIADTEPELNIEEQLFANILEQEIKSDTTASPITNSFRGRQPINNKNLIQRNKRPKFTSRNRNPLTPRKSSNRLLSSQKSRTLSSAINDQALRNRQRSRSRLRSRTKGTELSNNRVHPFSTTTEVPVEPISTAKIETTNKPFDLQSTLNLEDVFPIITSEAPETPRAEIAPRERFPNQPVQNTFITRARAPVERLNPTTPRARLPIEKLVPTTTFATPTESEYSDYYEYYDLDDDKTSGVPHPPPVKSIDNYDLFPLNNKVDIDDEGQPICHDVGVFPHPTSCRMFITCSRRTVTTNIVGWVYECPSYLAFDPVGGRCNWASDVVCT